MLQLCVCRDIEHLGSLESTQEALQYPSFVLSKLPACSISRHTHADAWTNSVGCLWHSHGKNSVRLYPKLQSQPTGLPKIFIDYLYFQADQSDCLLLDSQFGFRSSRSCELAIADLSDNILTNMDNQLLNGLLLVHLKKAFDLVDHDTLLYKLRIYGCSHSTMVWIRSYLSRRSQKTQFKGTLSEALPVSIGVSQGSVLGPLFFIIHINDLPLELHSDVT